MIQLGLSKIVIAALKLFIFAFKPFELFPNKDNFNFNCPTPLYFLPLPLLVLFFNIADFFPPATTTGSELGLSGVGEPRGWEPVLALFVAGKLSSSVLKNLLCL